MPKGKSCKPSTAQLSAQALTVTSMYQKLNKQLNFAITSTALVKPYKNLVSGLGSHLQQAVSCGYGVKSLTSQIKLIPTRTLIPGIASSVLSKSIIDVSRRYGVKSLTFHIKPIPTRVLISGIAPSILNKNIIDNCIVVPTNISKEISDTLGIADNNFEAAIPYNDSKKVSIDTFALYLTIISSIVGICMSFLYTPIRDYFSDKSTKKYQEEILQEERKQTKLLEKIYIDLQRDSSSSTTTEK